MDKQDMLNQAADVPAALAAGLALADVKSIQGMPAVIVPPGCKVETFEHLLEKPLRIKQAVVITTALSFIDYWQKFASDISMIFADLDNHNFKAVFDYHDKDQPAHGSHTATLKLQHSKEWDTWLNKNEVSFKQAEFAEFVEQNLPDIHEPIGAELLEVVRTLKANKKLAFKSGITLSNGQVQFEYNETIDGQAGPKGELRIPEQFVLGLRVFQGEEPYKVFALLRWRIADGGALTFFFSILRPERIIEDAFETVRTKLAAGCSGGKFISV
jgi:uncharacterized protein YfdQ (DUF2303 family)